MNICFLASKVTLPGSPTRRTDAFEHDYQVNAIRPGLEAKGHELTEVSWDDPELADMSFDAAIIGTTWDYWDHWENFLETLDSIEQRGIPLFNSAATVRWNSRKTYLQTFAEAGIPTIPTLWMDQPDGSELVTAFDHFDTETIVVKRQVGAGAVNQIKLKRGVPVSDYPYAAMVQPFIPQIQSEGEYSFIMINGELSHALVKRAKSGDYRIQSMYGGIEEAVSPPAGDLAAAKSVLEVLDDLPLYARVDMVRGEDGQLMLMELELIEPYLYPEQGPQLGPLFVDALLRRLA